MEHELRQDLLKQTREGNIYDWLATNGWRCSKDELIAIAEEIAYELNTCINLWPATTDSNESLAGLLEDAICDDSEE